MDSFFERPILDSPYAYPDRHWELDDDGQPTNQILPKRRESKLVTPVPKSQKRRHATGRSEMIRCRLAASAAADTLMYAG